MSLNLTKKRDTPKKLHLSNNLDLASANAPANDIHVKIPKTDMELALDQNNLTIIAKNHLRTAEVRHTTLSIDAKMQEWIQSSNWLARLHNEPSIALVDLIANAPLNPDLKNNINNNLDAKINSDWMQVSVEVLHTLCLVHSNSLAEIINEILKIDQEKQCNCIHTLLQTMEIYPHILTEATAECFAKLLPNHHAELLAQDDSLKIKDMLICHLLARPETAQYDEFKLFFASNNLLHIKAVVSNPAAIHMEGFANILSNHLHEPSIKMAFALNPEAPTHPKYKLLFKDPCLQIREMAASNPNAPMLEDYKLLFKDSFSVRRQIALNPNASRFSISNNVDILRNLIQNPQSHLCMEYNSLFNNNQLHPFLAQSPEASKYPQFVKLFQDKSLWEHLASNEQAILNPAYSNEYNTMFDSNSEQILINLAKNKNAPFHVGYKTFFYPRMLEKLGKFVASNPNAGTRPEFAELFYHKNLNVKISAITNPNATNSKEFKDLFSDPALHKYIAANPNVQHFPEFDKLFDSASTGFYADVLASNPNAPGSPRYNELFGYNWVTVKRGIAANEHAVPFPKFNILFYEPDELVQENLARNRQAATCKEYTRLIESKHRSVKLAVAKNEKAPIHTEFKALLTDLDFEVRKQAQITYYKNKAMKELGNSIKTSKIEYDFIL